MPSPPLPEPPEGTDSESPHDVPPAPVELVRRGVPRRLLLRFLLFLTLLVAAFLVLRFTPVAGYLTREQMVALLERLRLEWWTPLLLVVLYAVVACLAIPVSPLLFAGAVVFGAALGSVYNILGLLVGAVASFYLAKALGRDFVRHVAGPRLRRAERIFQRRGFWPLVQTRFLPIPFSVVSFAAALAGVRPVRFFAASALGLIPATVVHTYYAPKLVFSFGLALAVQYGVVVVVLNLIVGWPSIRERLERRRRFRTLQAQRRDAGRG